MSDLSENFKWIPGLEQKYVPRSEYLFKLLQPTLEDILLLGRSYESLFDVFEILFALSYSSSTGRNWGPPGRFGWKHKSWHGESPYNTLLEEAEKEQAKWGPIQGGLFEGSFENFTSNASAYKERLDKLSWW
jgi:hypothetical protein